MNNVFIYALIDPRTERVRYIGKTIQKPSDRLSAHIRSAKRGLDSYRDRWIRVLLKNNLNPVVEIIEIATDNWPEREKYWIHHYRSLGYKLTNVTDGGEGLAGHKFSKQHRTRIAKAQIGNKRGLGYKFPPEFGEQIRERMLKNNPMRGHDFSDEHRRKLGESHRGSNHTEETKKKMRQSAHKRNQDPEYIKKLSEAAKRRWAENRDEMLRITQEGAVQHWQRARADSIKEKAEAEK